MYEYTARSVGLVQLFFMLCLLAKACFHYYVAYYRSYTKMPVPRKQKLATKPLATLMSVQQMGISTLAAATYKV